jgi:hypothetical protein
MKTTLLLLLITLTTIVGSSQTKSFKRGICGDASPEDLAILSPYISWYYDWGVEPPAISQGELSGIEWVPMQWGGIGADQVENIKSRIIEGSLYLLGFNEPNFRSQANITPQQAAEMWPYIEEIAADKGLKLVSPAVNWCGDCVDGVTYDPTDWLDKFIAAYPDAHFDYIAIHSYAPYSAALKSYIDMFRKYNKPLWITEFAPWDAPKPDYAGVVQYMKETIPLVEADTSVFRYSWFATRVSSNPDIDLLGANGELTKLGKLYATMPFEGSSIDNIDPIAFLPSEKSINLPTAQVTIPGNTYYPNEDELSIEWSQISGPSQATFNDLSIAKPTISDLELGTYVFQMTVNANAKSDNAQITVVVNGENIAKHKPAKSSSNQDGNPPSNVNDGNLSTRWSSLDSDPQWIEIDLEGTYHLTGTKIEWETAYAKVYSIDISKDGDNWTSVYETSSGEGGSAGFSFNDTANYIRMYSTQRNTQEQWWGNSIWEFEVYGSEIETSLIESLSQNQHFNIFPNPATNLITIKTSELHGQAKLNIFDSCGRMIFVQQNNLDKSINTIDISFLQTGIYLITISNKAGIYKQHFIKK